MFARRRVMVGAVPSSETHHTPSEDLVVVEQFEKPKMGRPNGWCWLPTRAGWKGGGVKGKVERWVPLGGSMDERAVQEVEVFCLGHNSRVRLRR
jgi:hypothetical protein